MSKGIGGLANILKQAQAIQSRLEEVRQAAANKTVEASAGGGMVTVVVNGKLEVVKIRVERGLLDTGDVEMLQDLIVAAVNQGVKSAQRLMADEMSKLTGGLAIPGLTP